MVPLLAFCLLIGVYPKPLIDIVRPDVQAIARVYDALRVREHAQPVAQLDEGAARAPAGEVTR